MEGIDIKIDYIAGRSRLKSLCAPFSLLPILLLLYLWAGQNNIVNFIEYKAIHMYDSSFTLNISSLEKSIEDRLLAVKNKPSDSTVYQHASKIEINSSSEQLVKDYIFISLSFITTMFSMWSLLFISIYAFLYSLLLFIPVAAFLLCKNKYPNWLYNWNKEALAYFIRVVSYFLLVSPNFPAIDDEKDITVIIPDPIGSNLSRWQPLFKWLLVIPHALILFILFFVSLFVGFFAYLYTIASGTYPRSAFNFMVKCLRWNVRVICYSNILVTDKYPPFSFK